MSAKYVNDTALKRLICTVCKKYLSQIPIYSHSQLGSYCGRCQLVNNVEGFVRNDIYEELIKNQKFPCINNMKGCLQSLYPTEVPGHEKTCIYRDIVCPRNVIDNCFWSDKFSNITEHFEQCHPVFILRDSSFEVDLMSSHREIYVIPVEKDIYLLETNVDYVENSFTINVSYLGAVPLEAKHIYKVVLTSSTNSKNNFKRLQDIGSKFKMDCDYMRNALSDPLSIIAQIQIEEKPEKLEISNIDKEQLRAVECIVCFDYMLPPIFLCGQGHSICGNCKNVKNVTECPTCKNGFSGTRNYTLEEIVQYWRYPCRYETYGCKFVTEGKNIATHQAVCKYGPFNCPLETSEECHTKLAFKDLYKHIKDNHFESLLELDTISMPFDDDLQENIEDCYIILNCSHLFKLHFLYDHNSKIFKWTVHLIGSPKTKTTYKYSIDLIDQNKNSRHFMESHCITRPINAFEDKEDFVSLNYDEVIKFIKYQLAYRVVVLVL